MLELTINVSAFEVRNLEDLKMVLSRAAESQFSEVWLCKPQGGPSLCALINGESAWLIYLRHSKGDPGFSTRNPNYAGPREAMIEFRLSWSGGSLPSGVEHHDTGSAPCTQSLFHNARPSALAGMAR